MAATYERDAWRMNTAQHRAVYMHRASSSIWSIICAWIISNLRKTNNN